MVKKFFKNMKIKSEIKQKALAEKNHRRVEYKGDLYYVSVSYELDSNKKREYAHCSLFNENGKYIIQKRYRGYNSEVDVTKMVIESYRETQYVIDQEQKQYEDFINSKETLILR